MSGTVTFDGAPPPGTINFGIGQPSADLLPVDLVRQASQSFFDSAQPFELNYGVLQSTHGLASFRSLHTRVYSVILTDSGGRSLSGSYSQPPLITRQMVCVLRMSSRGLASNNTISASFPASREPK